ncbi:efflux transporter outer membrane subunit [Paralcaligenes sp. KSB-10]|uniref:efflux transporter outer membrane subunit n=1 Tax=Paralcaligenes sp. KSB-10 TaxID=2901142 RepID=UPI001E43175E|nr:efflux transporter outer membrane subunit [Paralcaligenes sp. KSB-10]UHL65369.1 efflux transporter outer membrane subunit [Paralcaligenes sp. KSB-10]
MKPLLPLLLLAALTGCAAINPGEPGLKEIQGAQLGLQTAAIDWPTEQWWLRYKDPQLDSLIDQALQNNPSLAAAKARLGMANAAVSGARAVQLPQLNANYQMTRERFSENYIYPPPYAGSMQTDNTLQLQLGFDLDLWGKNRARYAAAVSRVEASKADAQLARNALVSAVTQSYFNLQNALAQHQVIAQIVRQLEDVAKITHQRVVAGLDTQVEVNQADSAVSAAKVQLSQVGTNADLLRHQLSALVGAGPDRGMSIERAKLPAVAAGVPALLPMNLLGRRPDIVAAKRLVEASSSEISAAKAEFFPDINLSAFAGFMSLGLDNLLKNGSKVYGAGPAITLPIFHGGALNAQLNAKRSERDLAIANYNQAVLTAVREVADASTAIRALQQQIVDQHASYTAISSAYDIAVQRYRSGLGNYVQVLLAQNEVQKQAILDTDLQARAYNLDAQLATALGGGYRSAPAAGTSPGNVPAMPKAGALH